MPTPSEYDALNAICRESLEAFTCKAFTIAEAGNQFEYNWHIGCIADHLQAVYKGEIDKLIINMPPRAGKTLSTSVALPAWAMGKTPTIKFMLTSFKAPLAENMTRKTRAVMKSDWYKSCFPDTVVSSDMDRQYHFETTAGGQYISSAMESATGSGCDIQICDDPLQPNEAASDKARQNSIDTIRGTLFSRFNDPRKLRFILNMQRLHENDPTGDLLKDGGWTHLKLPAEAKGKSYHIILGNKKWEMPEGTLLFPSRFTPEVLDEKRTLLGDYNYAGQFLQEPVPIGGGEFNEGWLQFYMSGGVKPKEMNVVILVDPAGGEELNKRKKKSSDWTVMDVWGLANDNNYYLLDRIRDRLNPTDRVNTLFMLHRLWNEKCGKPPKVGYEKYGMMTDTHYIREKQKQDCYNFPLVELGGATSKEERIRRLIPDMQNGRFFFPVALPYIDQDGRKWDMIDEMRSEMKSFPRAKHDDIMDCWARIYEPELFLVFPKPRDSMVSKAYAASSVKADSWETW